MNENDSCNQDAENAESFFGGFQTKTELVESAKAMEIKYSSNHSLRKIV